MSADGDFLRASKRSRSISRQRAAPESVASREIRWESYGLSPRRPRRAQPIVAAPLNRASKLDGSGTIVRSAMRRGSAPANGVLMSVVLPSDGIKKAALLKAPYLSPAAARFEANQTRMKGSFKLIPFVPKGTLVIVVIVPCPPAAPPVSVNPEVSTVAAEAGTK